MVAALACACLVGCESDEPVSDVPASIAEVYAGVDASLAATGGVYRAEVRGTDGPFATSSVLWASHVEEAARRQLATPEGAPYTSVWSGERLIVLGPTGDFSVGQAPDCDGASTVAAAVLDCPDAAFETYTFSAEGSPVRHVERPSIGIEAATFEGGAAVLLRASKRQQPFRASPFTEERRVYLEPGTLLPLAIEVDRDGVPISRVRYEHTFVAADSLARGFFEPEALALERPDPEETLRSSPPGHALYWLGPRFDGAAAVPPLQLWRVSRYDGGDPGWPAEQVMLEYVRADDTFGEQPFLRLTAYNAATWALLPPSTQEPGGTCWTSEEIALPGGRAVLYSGFNWPDNVPAPPGACPSDRPPDRFEANAFLGETVVQVAPWMWPGQTRAGIEAVLGALEARPAA